MYCASGRATSWASSSKACWANRRAAAPPIHFPEQVPHAAGDRLPAPRLREDGTLPLPYVDPPLNVKGLSIVETAEN